MKQPFSITNKLNNCRVLSGSTLKILAIILMLIDHIGAVVVYQGYLLQHLPIIRGTSVYDVYTFYRILRFIGRGAFPIFCFLLVQGYIHTSDRKKYGIRLLIFAIISEIPFNLAIYATPLYPSSQNVFFTLFIGFCVIWAIDYLQEKPLVITIITAFGMGLAYMLKTDYSYWGILLIVILYLFRYQKGLQTLAGCVALFWEAPACLAFIPLNLYNGKKGLSLKYFFYLFYPLHLLLLAAIRYICFGI